MPPVWIGHCPEHFSLDGEHQPSSRLGRSCGGSGGRSRCWPAPLHPWLVCGVEALLSDGDADAVEFVSPRAGDLHPNVEVLCPQEAPGRTSVFRPTRKRFHGRSARTTLLASIAKAIPAAASDPPERPGNTTHAGARHGVGARGPNHRTGRTPPARAWQPPSLPSTRPPKIVANSD